MTAIFNGPVAPVGVEDTFWVGLLWCSAGDAISDFTRGFASLFLCRVPLDEEGLSDVGKVKVVVEFRGGPDFSGFDSSMVRGRVLNEIRLLPILEPQSEVFENSVLVSLNGEVIVGMTLRDQRVGYLALGQESIGRYILPLNIEGLKQGEGHLNLVGAFEFFILF